MPNVGLLRFMADFLHPCIAIVHPHLIYSANNTKSKLMNYEATLEEITCILSYEQRFIADVKICVKYKLCLILDCDLSLLTNQAQVYVKFL